MLDNTQSPWVRQDFAHDANDPYPDPKSLFRGLVAEIGFHSSTKNGTVKIIEDKSVSEIIDQGPSIVLGSESSEVRWIHLPANNMAWVKELMEGLNEEQKARNANVDEEERETARYDGILRDDVWKNAFHGRKVNSIHSRFMRPLAINYSSADLEGPQSDDGDAVQHQPNIVALYLPYLHWESYNTWKDRQRHIAELKKLAHGKKFKAYTDVSSETLYHSDDAGKALLHTYLSHDSPLHDRRTLDQSYFYNLRDVAHKDRDQVIGQHTWNKASKEDPGRKMMMTDQLWLWVVDGTTIITAFPQTGRGRNDSGDDDADVLCKAIEVVQEEVRQGSVRSMNGLVALLVNQCTGVFHRTDISPDLAFLEFFADEIGQAGAEIARMSSDFHSTSRSIAKLWRDEKVSWERMSLELDILFSIQEEINLIGKVEKIIADLDKIDFLCGQQEDVVSALLKCCKTVRHRTKVTKTGQKSISSSTSDSRSLTELLETLKIRRNAWSGMNETAKNMRDSLHHLLDLKQRQATVSEARTVRSQIEIAAQQGQSVMVLTIFTVFLLPISVVATIFGMNASELVGKDGGKVSVGTITAITFPITAMMVLFAFLFAFNARVRGAVGQVYAMACEKYVTVLPRKRTEVFTSNSSLERG